MRAEEGEESIEELAKDAAKAEETLEKAVGEKPEGHAQTKPPHRDN